jgi:hypothetical protein
MAVCAGLVMGWTDGSFYLPFHYIRVGPYWVEDEPIGPGNYKVYLDQWAPEPVEIAASSDVALILKIHFNFIFSKSRQLAFPVYLSDVRASQ